MKSEINVDDDQSGGPIPLGIGSSEAEPAGVCIIRLLSVGTVRSTAEAHLGRAFTS